MPQADSSFKVERAGRIVGWHSHSSRRVLCEAGLHVRDEARAAVFATPDQVHPLLEQGVHLDEEM